MNIKELNNKIESLNKETNDLTIKLKTTQEKKFKLIRKLKEEQDKLQNLTPLQKIYVPKSLCLYGGMSVIFSHWSTDNTPCFVYHNHNVGTDNEEDIVKYDSHVEYGLKDTFAVRIQDQEPPEDITLLASDNCSYWSIVQYRDGEWYMQENAGRFYHDTNDSRKFTIHRGQTNLLTYKYWRLCGPMAERAVEILKDKK